MDYCTFPLYSLLLCSLNLTLRFDLPHPLHKHVLATLSLHLLPLCPGPVQAPRASASEPHIKGSNFVKIQSHRRQSQQKWGCSSPGCLNSHRHGSWLIQVNIHYKSWSFLYPSHGIIFTSWNFLCFGLSPKTKCDWISTGLFNEVYKYFPWFPPFTSLTSESTIVTQMSH